MTRHYLVRYDQTGDAALREATVALIARRPDQAQALVLAALICELLL
jgi:hypothetical protein